jgi:hypothetical protein
MGEAGIEEGGVNKKSKPEFKPPVVDKEGWTGTDRWAGFKCKRDDHRCSGEFDCMSAHECVEGRMGIEED